MPLTAASPTLSRERDGGNSSSACTRWVGLLGSAVRPQGRQGPQSLERSGTPESLRSPQDLPLNQKGPGKKAPPHLPPNPAPRRQEHAAGHLYVLFPQDNQGWGAPSLEPGLRNLPPAGGARQVLGSAPPAGWFSGRPSWVPGGRLRGAGAVGGARTCGARGSRVSPSLLPVGGKGGSGVASPLGPHPSGLSGKAPTRGSSMGP